MDDEEIELQEGMPVANEAGDSLGKLSALLIPNEEEEAEFLLLDAQGRERLVPFEAVLGVGDGNLILDVPTAALERYPVIAEGAEPSNTDAETAYRVYDETAEYVLDEEE